MIVQLAKMTLIVLGIFFTPAITRKFVFQLTAPEASQMMKWGGVVTGGVGAVGLKSLAFANAAKSIGGLMAQREIPAASQELARISNKISNSDFGRKSRLVNFSKNLIEGGNRKVQDWHLSNLHKKRGTTGKLNSSNERAMPNERESFDRFRAEFKERKDPVSGKNVYPGQPKAGVLSRSIRLGDQFASVGTSVAKNGFRITNEVASRFKPQIVQSQSPSPTKMEINQKQGSPWNSRSELSREAPQFTPSHRAKFYNRVQRIMSQNQKRIDKILKGDKS